MPKTKKSTLTNTKVNKEIQELEKKNQLIDVEQFYVNGQLENLDHLIELKKNELIDKMIKYQTELSPERQANPYLISTYFFKTINPLTSQEPAYSPEKLAIVWDLYMYLIEQVNANIGVFQPTITHFCKFAGITMSTFKMYKVRGTYEMQVLINKICDETFNSNVLLAQTNRLSNRSTELRVKVENEVQEKPQVHVNVNVNEEIDLDSIASRINELSSFRKTKKSIGESVEGDIYEQ